MRLLFRNDHWEPHFTFIWEVELLCELGDRWVPFAFPDHVESLGEIHAQTHEIRFLPEISVPNRQIVVLLPPPPDGNNQR